MIGYAAMLSKCSAARVGKMRSLPVRWIRSTHLKPCYGVDRAQAILPVADQLPDRPRPLVVFVEESDHDAPVVAGVAFGCRVVRLFLHWSFASFAGLGRFAAVPGPL
jgi:hypothetical protein